MGWMDEYNKALKEEKKKKKKETSTSSKSSSSFMDEYREELDEIAPVVQAGNAGNVNPIIDEEGRLNSLKSDGRTWFQKGLFEDGYQFGDLTKTILGTGKDASEDALTGGLGVGEEIVDFFASIAPYITQGMYYANGGGYNVQADQAFRQAVDASKAGTEEFIKKDLYDEEKVAKKILSGSATSQALKAWGTDSEEASVLGEKSDALMQSTGKMGVQLALNAAVPGSSAIPGMVLMGATALGSEAENALNQGANLDEAVFSGAISAGAEILSEKLGGISFGGKTLTDAAFQTLSRHMTGKMAKILLTTGKLTADATSEGLEEIFSGWMGAVGQKLSYMEDKEIEELFSKDDALESFLGGFILGGAGGTGGVIKATTQGKDYVTGMTKNEQTVVNKLYEDAVAEESKNGKVTEKRKSEIYDSIVEQMDKGYISTDAIESILGGETYKSYTDTVKSEDSLVEQEKTLTEEFNKLNRKPWRDMTGEEHDRLDELKEQLPKLREQIKANEKNGTRKNLKSQLSTEVSELVKGDRLVESYNEKIRMSQSFIPEYDKYKGTKHEDAAKKTLESAIKAGANNSNRVRDLVEMAAQASADTGLTFEFKSGENIKKDFIARQTAEIAKLEAMERTAEQDQKLQKLKETLAKVESGEVVVNGDISGGNVVLNLDSHKPLNRVVGHEITHSLEPGKGQNTKEYTALKDSLFAYAKTKGIDVDAKLKSLAEQYEGVTDANPEAELVADLVGDFLFTDSKYIQNLSTGNRNLFQRLWDEVKYLCKIATAGSQEARELARVQKAFEDAYRENGSQSVEKNSGNTKYSLEKQSKSKYNKRSRYSETETLFLSWENGSAPVGEVKKFVRYGKTHYYEKTENGCVELSRSQYNERNGAYVENIDRRAERETGETYDYDASTQRGTLGHPYGNRDTRGTAAVFGQTFREELQHDTAGSVSGTLGHDSRTDIKQSEYRAEASDDSDASFVTFSNDYATIRNAMKDGDVSKDSRAKYSLSDSDGKQLTKEQSEFFKDSKIVDADGNLKVMHHGSPESFTVFDKKKAKASGYYGKGFYFTDSDSHAKQYGNTYDVYLNITNPLQDGTKDITKDQLRKFVEAIAENEDYGIDNYGYDATVDSVTDSVYGKSDFAMLMDINASCVGNMVEAIELFNEVNGTDYNGIVAPTETVAFYPDQIKNIDNLKPTSDPDIRYSLSERSYAEIQEEQQNLYRRERDLMERKREAESNPELLQAMDDYSNLFSEMRGLLAKRRQGTATQEELDRIEEIKALREEKMQRVADIQESLGLKALSEEAEEIRKTKEELRKASDAAWAREGAEKENKAIEKSGLSAPEYFRKKALKAFKTTTNFNEAGYLLPDGKLLNFSGGERNHRHRDHREIGEIYEATNGTDALNRFLSDGNIRIMAESPGIDLASGVEPTREQYAALRKFINTNGVADGQFFVDFSGADGRRVGNYSYNGRVNAERVLNDIKYFYQNGEVREQSSIGQFLSMSAKGEDIAPMGDFDVYGSDFGVKEDIAPVGNPVETVAENTQVNAEVPVATEEAEDIAPVMDEAPPKKFDPWEANGVEKPVSRSTRKELHSNIVENIRSAFFRRGFDFDDVLKKAKNLSTFATVDNTPQRVMEKSLGYKEGQILSDMTVNQVAQNETEKIKWLNSFTDRKSGLLAQISKQYNIKPGSKESAAAQMYAEGFYVNENNEIVQYGDAELAADFKDAQVQRNIKGLANDPRIRQIYDDTLAMINESRARNLYPEIPRLDNYFLHFRAMDDTFSRLGLPFNPNDIKAKDLPTDLNGVTADLKPGQPYFASAKHRMGKRTSFDLLGGLERYLTSAGNQIYHIDDIQTLRALRNYIADTYGQANGLEGLDELSEEEAQERIKQVYGSHLSTFAKFLNEEANIIAGKTALIDRGLEGIIGRRGITFLDSVNKQVGSNMVGYNISSSLTNFLPVAQTFAKSNKFDFVKAFAQTVSNKVSSVYGKGDDFAENSPVVIRRKGADRFYRTPWQKLSDPGYALMGIVDDISTELIARTKYNELTRNGMDSQTAHYETDKWVSRLMGDRSMGQMPQIYNSKMLGLITKFQLEVRNQLDSQFYDTIQEAKVSNEDIESGLARNAKIAAKVGSTFVQLAVVQHLFGKAFESVAGYNPAFDIIETIITAFGWDDEEEEPVLDNIEEAFLGLLEDLPYTSTFTGGRIPISNALPIKELFTGKDEYGNEKSRLETLGEAAPYYLLPGGYGQIKKTVQGLGMFSEDHPISGSYTDSGKLRFPVEDTFGNRLQAGIFGQYASKNARDYFDNGRSPLAEKQIEEFMSSGMKIQDYWGYREGLSGLSKLSEKADYIDSLDLTDEQKNLFINNIADRKEDIDMSTYGDYDSFEEFDYATKNPEKYDFLTKIGVSYKDFASATDEKGKNVYSDMYTWVSNEDHPGRYDLSKAVADDFQTFWRYKSELGSLEADKDEDGESINGSKKEKVIDYINNLDLDYGQKIILFRSMYSSKADKNTYNSDIVDYLNSRDDISYEEMETILKELGFTVDSNGNISWD